MKKDLTQLEQNQCGKVVEILGGSGICRKLDALGIRVGSEITKISSITSKGPVIIQLGSSQIVLGYGMAKKIIVEV